MYSVEMGQKRTQGRHAGWITVDECIGAAKTLSTTMGFPDCTVADIKQMIERCSVLELLDTKDCDTNDGFQQYLKTSSGYAAYKAYTTSIHVDASQDGSAERWWTMNSKGAYHPDGPSAKSREYFQPVINHVLKGVWVKQSLDGADGFERPQM
jgi:hypothetical protein